MNTTTMHATLTRAADLIAPAIVRKALRLARTLPAPRAADAAATQTPARGCASPARSPCVLRNSNSEARS